MDDDVRTKPPVLVLGNGPVGQTAALLLARWGVPVVLLDRRPYRDPVGSKAICQQRDVLDIWAHVGAGEQIADEGLTWERAVTFYKGRELFRHGFLDTGASPFPPFVNIGQNRTEQVLDERIAAQPLIDVRWGHHVMALDQDADGVHLTCQIENPPDPADPATGDEVGRTVHIDGSYAVACPGARGDNLRQLLGLSFEGSTFADQFLICDIRTHLPGWEQERRFYFDPEWNPGRQVLIHPCPDSTFRIDWQVPPDYDLAAEEADGSLETRIRMIIGDADYEIVWKSVYRFHSRRVDRMRVGRVLVAGDAAHLVAPFGARGLNSGVPDAENAAWKIAYAWHGWGEDEGLLASYDVERGAAADENLAVTSATMAFLVPQDEAAWKRRRDILEAAAVDPSAYHQVDSGRLAEAFWYIDSPLTRPDPSRPFAGRPHRGEAPLPAPGVAVPDVPIWGFAAGASTRLRQIMRDGVTVLLAPGAGMSVAATRAEVAAAAGPGPVQVIAMADLGEDVAGALRARPGEAWVVRPDAYVAAIVATDSVTDGVTDGATDGAPDALTDNAADGVAGPDPGGVAAAVRRLLHPGVSATP